MNTFTLKVIELKKETNDAVTVCFKQPGLKKIKYLPGQYLTLIFRINGRRYIRPYSLSSAPLVDANLEVTIKRVPGGIISNHIIDMLKVDDIVEMMQPMGDFMFARDKFTTDQHIVLWGAGSGITPLMSIAKDILYQNTGHKVTLVYGNRHKDEVIFYDKIKELVKAFPEQLNVWNFYTRLVVDHNNPDHIQGRIAPDKVLTVLKSITDLKDSVHYICGPTGLKESVKKALQPIGVKDDHVFTEDFELQKDPKDFEDITTRYVQITIGGTNTSVEVAKGKSILEAGLDASLELPYACQTGHCTVCKAKIAGGQVKMIGITKLPDDLKNDEYLTCCAYPLSDDVHLML